VEEDMRGEFKRRLRRPVRRKSRSERAGIHYRIIYSDK